MSITCEAQKSGVALADSLISEINTAKDDTAKARLYNRIFNTYLSVDLAKAFQYAQIGCAHVGKMKWDKGIAVFQNNLGQYYSETGNFDSSFYFYSASLVTHTKSKDKYNMAVINNNLGSLASNLRSDFSMANQYYFKALQLAEEIKDSNLTAICVENIGNIYNLQKNFSKAMEYSLRALRLREKLGVPDDIAKSLEAVGKVYSNQENISKAREYYLQSQVLYENSGNLQGLASVYGSLSLTWPQDFRKAIEYRLKAKEIWDEVNPMHPTAITNLGNIGVGYLEIVKFDSLHSVKYGGIIPDSKSQLLQKAETALLAAIQLANQVGDIDNSSYFTGSLAEVQELKADFKNAYYNLKLYNETQDSLFSQENKNKIAAAESQRELDKKNSELRIHQLRISNQRKAMWGLIAGLGSLVIIGSLLYRQNKLRKKNNEQLLKLNAELDKANKVKTKFFGILSHDLRSPVANLVNFLYLQKNSPELLSFDQAIIHRQKIERAADDLLNNMESILLWSKSQMEKFEPVPVPVNPVHLFSKVVQAFSENRNLQFAIKGDNNLQINTDENYLHTIIYNLVANAVKALTNQPDAKITLSATKVYSKTILTVADNGNGFPLQFLTNWEADRLTISGKHGLGMHIIKDMAAAIGCKIELSNDSAGACCKLYL